MSDRYYRLRIAGIPVNLHPSLLFLLGLFFLMALAGGGSGSDIARRLITPVLLFAVVLAHELGHALAARRLGVNVVDILLTPLGGAARLEGLPRNPRVEVYIALAGPMVNLALALVAFAALSLLRPDTAAESMSDAVRIHEQGAFLWTNVLEVAWIFNILLGTVNLIPAFPTDGGRIFRGLLALKVGRLNATRTATRVGSYFGLGCLLSPFFVDGTLAWTLPFLGLFIIYSGFRERLMVEAQEGPFGGGGFSFNMFNQRRPGQNPFESKPQHSIEEDPDANDPNVIDTEGSSRILDD